MINPTFCLKCGSQDLNAGFMCNKCGENNAFNNAFTSFTPPTPEEHGICPHCDGSGEYRPSEHKSLQLIYCKKCGGFLFDFDNIDNVSVEAVCSMCNDPNFTPNGYDCNGDPIQLSVSNTASSSTPDAELRGKILHIQQGLASDASNLRIRYETNKITSSEFSLRIAKPITDSTDQILALITADRMRIAEDIREIIMFLDMDNKALAYNKAKDLIKELEG